MKPTHSKQTAALLVQVHQQQGDPCCAHSGICHHTLAPPQQFNQQQSAYTCSRFCAWPLSWVSAITREGQPQEGWPWSEMHVCMTVPTGPAWWHHSSMSTSPPTCMLMWNLLTPHWQPLPLWRVQVSYACRVPWTGRRCFGSHHRIWNHTLQLCMHAKQITDSRLIAAHQVHDHTADMGASAVVVYAFPRTMHAMQCVLPL